MPIRRGEEKTAPVSRGFFLPLALLVLFLDQLTKIIASRFLDLHSSVPVLPPIFHLTFVENTGIAFGLFQRFENVLFWAVTASIVLLAWIGFHSDPQRQIHQWGIGLILGGAVGNWVDRVRVGAVIDFLDFRIWPVFNLADTAITVGVGLFLLELLRRPRHVS